MKLKMQLLAMLSLLMGAGYVLMPEIEVEARFFGLLSVFAGVMILVLQTRAEKNKSYRWLGVFGFGLLAIAQWFPIEAWTFSPMLTDHALNPITVSLAENGHIGLLPHLVIFSLSLHLALSFLRDVMKKKWNILSVWLILALAMGAWSLVWLADFRNTFDNVMEDNNPHLMNIDIDQLKYQMRQVAKEVTEEQGYWEAGDGGYWYESEELGIRLFVPELWLPGDPEEQGMYPEFTSFTNNVIPGEKWELQMNGEGYGMWPKMEAYRDLYPFRESFFYSSRENEWGTEEAIYQANMMGGYDTTQLACDAFKSLVIASGDCARVEGLPMDVYRVDYATISEPEFFSLEDSELVGGFIWFVSLKGYNSSYGGFLIDYQMVESLTDEGLFHEKGPDGMAEDFLSTVLDGKASEDYQEFEEAMRQLLSSAEPLSQ